MAGTFDGRIDRLMENVGTGKLVAGCKVNQPYAQNQHQNLSFRHPHGGRSHYLGGPLLENSAGLLEGIARAVLSERGSSVRFEMAKVAEEMNTYVLENAPVETGRLRTSGNPWAEDNGLRYYERPPISPRESD